MSKKLLFKVLVALCFVAVAVVWLLSALDVIEVNMSWLIAIFAFALAALFIIYGFASKTVGVAKKLYIVFGGALAVAGVFALIGSFMDKENVARLVLPIIAIAVTVVVLLCILAVGGKKWDQADNENVGYKDYRTRKREEEERKRQENENEQDK